MKETWNCSIIIIKSIPNILNNNHPFKPQHLNYMLSILAIKIFDKILNAHVLLLIWIYLSTCHPPFKQCYTTFLRYVFYEVSFYKLFCLSNPLPRYILCPIHTKSDIASNPSFWTMTKFSCLPSVTFSILYVFCT